MLKKFGRYEILEHIADGGMASVNKAYDPILGRKVALKIVKASLLEANQVYAKMFLEEAATMGNLEHPHILPVYDYGYSENKDHSPFVVTRLVKNGSLHDYLQNESMTSMQVIWLTERIASAIDYFHHQGIMHRDLKPSNILIADQTHPYITDFGLTHVPEELRNSHTGSPFFISPEQWLGDVDNYRSDLFSFGLIIFFCFTGLYPVPEGMNTKYNPKIKEYRINPNMSQIRSIREHLPHLPIGVELVLDRLTRYDPNERYATASEAAEALRQSFQSGQKDIKGKVFISYAHKDAEYVHRLAEQLALINIDIWIDKNIQPGSNWDRNIESVLEAADKMLLILSPAAVASDNVHDEWSYFLEEGKEIYPLVYETCDIPFRLRRKQYITSSQDILADVSKVIDILAGGIPTKIPSYLDDVDQNLSENEESTPFEQAQSIEDNVQHLQLSTNAYIPKYSEVLDMYNQMRNEDGITHVLDASGVSRPIDEVITEFKKRMQNSKDD